MTRLRGVGRMAVRDARLAVAEGRSRALGERAGRRRRGGAALRRRVRIEDAEKRTDALMLCVEEGTFANGQWVTSRVWNGDQTDYGINLIDRPQILKVTMGRYRS